MIIAMIKGASRICGKAQGYLGLPVRDMILIDKATGQNTPAMETAWTPTPDELDRLNKGANIIVRILGSTPAPMLVMVDTELPEGECTLYRQQYLTSHGYVVYRTSFEPLKCTIEEWILAHKQAVFVDEVAAQHYCDHRNMLTMRNGSDALA